MHLQLKRVKGRGKMAQISFSNNTCYTRKQLQSKCLVMVHVYTKDWIAQKKSIITVCLDGFLLSEINFTLSHFQKHLYAFAADKL